MNISDRIEGVLSWYSSEGRNKLSYAVTRWLGPFIALSLFLTLITVIYRPFAWVTAVSCLVGFIAFLVGLLLGMAGTFAMNLEGGPGDSLGWNIGAGVVVLAAGLSLWALVCFASMIMCFAVLGVEAPVGW